MDCEDQLNRVLVAPNPEWRIVGQPGTVYRIMLGDTAMSAPYARLEEAVRDCPQAAQGEGVDPVEWQIIQTGRGL